MDSNQFKGNVFKTLSQKPARAGLRHIAGNQLRTNLFHVICGIASETNELFKAFRLYVLGEQFKDEHKGPIIEEFGDLAYFLTVGAKLLKVKMPGAGKKVKLEGTRLAALLDLIDHADYLLDLQKKYFYGVKTKDEPYPAGVRKLKGIDTPYEAGVRKVIDKDAQKVYDDEFQKKVVERLPVIFDLLQRLVFDTLKEPMGFVFDTEMAKLAVRYPEGTFDMRSQEQRKADREVAAISKASETPVVQPVEAAA